MKPDGLLIAAGVIAVLVVTYFLVKLQAKQARRLAENYIAENQLDAECVSTGVPPLRLWLRNRKGDRWAKLRSVDGTEVWLRVRHTLLSGTKYDLFS